MNLARGKRPRRLYPFHSAADDDSGSDGFMPRDRPIPAGPGSVRPGACSRAGAQRPPVASGNVDGSSSTSGTSRTWLSATSDLSWGFAG
jgi:hypothetical protein